MSDKLYVMPRAIVGPCVWRDRPGADEVVAALITEVGQRTVGVTLFPPGSRVGITRQGVRHVSDPEFPKLVAQEGVWDYTAEQLQAALLTEAFLPPNQAKNQK